MFTYSEDDREIEGWTTRTRTLGTYIVSDTELDIDSYYDDDDDTEVPVDRRFQQPEAGPEHRPLNQKSLPKGPAGIARGAFLRLAAKK